MRASRQHHNEAQRRTGAGRAMVLAFVSLLAASPASAAWVKTPRLPTSVCTGDQVVKYASGADLTCSADMATQAELDAVAAAVPGDRAKVACSGSNDTAAINAAITAVSTNGGIVLLPATTCRIASDIAVPPKVQIVGVPGSIIKPIGTPTFTNGIFVFSGQGVRFADFECDLDAATNKPCITSTGSVANTNNVTIERVYVWDASNVASAANPYIKISCTAQSGGIARCATINALRVTCGSTSGVNDIGLQIDACDNSLACAAVTFNSSQSDINGAVINGCGVGIKANGLVAVNDSSIDTLVALTGAIGVDSPSSVPSTVSNTAINLRTSTNAFGFRSSQTVGKLVNNRISGTSGGNGTVGISGAIVNIGNSITLNGTGVIGIAPAYQSSSTGNAVTVNGTGARGISCATQCSVGAGNNIVAGGTGAIGVALRGQGATNTTGGFVVGNMINSSGTDSAGVVCGAQQSQISSNWISGTVGVRPPYVEGAMFNGAEFTTYVNCRVNDNLLSFLTIGIEIGTGWHVANNTINWLGANSTGILIGSQDKYGTCTGHSIIEGNNIHASDATSNLIRFTRIGKRCLNDADDTDYLQNCTTGNTACGGSACTCGNNSDGDGTSNACTSMVKPLDGCTGVSISNNLLMGNTRSGVDVYSDATAGTQISEAPDVWDVSIRDNFDIMPTSGNLVRFPSTPADVTNFVIGSNENSDFHTTPIANWNAAYGWVDSAIGGTPFCREITQPVTNGTYAIAITNPYGGRLMAISCACQTNCTSRPTLTVQDRTPTAYSVTGSCGNGTVTRTRMPYNNECTGANTPYNCCTGPNVGTCDSGRQLPANAALDIKTTGTITSSQVDQVCVYIQQ